MKNVYDKNEFRGKSGLAEDVLDKMIAAEIVRPAGSVDGGDPYFDDACLEMADAASKLLDMGYSLEEVVRIRRKVGLPKRKDSGKGLSGPLLTVGELAKRAGTNARTIKHWEEKGIIMPDSHSPGGFRLYRERYVQICVLMQDLQNFGFTLEEIKGVADLVRGYVKARDDFAAVPAAETVERVKAIREQIKELNQRMRKMESGIERWRRVLKRHHKEMGNLQARAEKEIQTEAKPAVKRNQDDVSPEGLAAGGKAVAT